MKADAYYSLHRHLWSIVAREGAQKGRVVAHLPRVFVADAEMIVRPAGRARPAGEAQERPCLRPRHDSSRRYLRPRGRAPLLLQPPRGRPLHAARRRHAPVRAPRGPRRPRRTPRPGPRSAPMTDLALLCLETPEADR